MQASRLGSDPSVARRLIGRRRLHATFATYADAAGVVFDPMFVSALRRQLAAISITVTVIPVPQTDSPAQRSLLLAGADITRVGGNASEARDPVEYLRSLPYLPAVERAELERIANLPPPRREASAAPIAAHLARNAFVVGVADLATPELVSARLGCVIDHPEYPGLDLAALCLPGTRG